MALFESPSQVRRRIAQESMLYAGQGGGGGLFAPAYRGISQIGAALGTAAGLAGNPQVRRAQEIQGLQKQYFSGIQPGEFPTKLPGFASALAEKGYTDEALKVMAYAKELNPSADYTEFLKEERKQATKTVNTVESRAGEIRGAEGKLVQLAKRAKGAKPGSVTRRAAINSMIANIVRLNSPGIVSESELKTYSGGQGTTAAFVSLLAGKDPQYEALLAGIDPSGADPDAMLGLGRSLIMGDVPQLLDRYEDARSRAERAKLSKRAQGTIFGGSKNIEALKKISQPQAKGVPDGIDPEDWKYMTPEERALF